MHLHANLQNFSRPTRSAGERGRRLPSPSPRALRLAQRRLCPAAVAKLLEVSGGLRGAHGYRRIEVRFDESSLIDLGHVCGPAAALRDSFF